MIVYSSQSGMRLFEKDIFCSSDITCLSLECHLLFIGSIGSIEVWDINCSTCLAIIQPSNSLNSNCFVKNICSSDFIVLGMLSNSKIVILPIQSIIKESLKCENEPAIVNWETSSIQISNNDLVWKNMSLWDDKFVFGLEKKLGDIKVYKWLNENSRQHLSCASQDDCLNICGDDSDIDLK